MGIGNSVAIHKPPRTRTWPRRAATVRPRAQPTPASCRSAAARRGGRRPPRAHEKERGEEGEGLRLRGKGEGARRGTTRRRRRRPAPPRAWSPSACRQTSLLPPHCPWRTTTPAVSNAARAGEHSDLVHSERPTAAQPAQTSCAPCLVRAAAVAHLVASVELAVRLLEHRHPNLLLSASKRPTQPCEGAKRPRPHTRGAKNWVRGQG